VVPAREGLRLLLINVKNVLPPVGEVVPAREGLRRVLAASRSLGNAVGEVVPAREGLRPIIRATSPHTSRTSEKWFQQEKD